MSWCPKCKCEYRKGITICADCKVELVESLDAENDALTAMVISAQAEAAPFISRFQQYMEYSKLPNKLVQNEEGLFEIYTTEKCFEQAKRCFESFYTGENERMQNASVRQQVNALKSEAGMDVQMEFEEEEDEDPGIQIQLVPDVPKEFKSAVDQFEDYRSSAYAFSVVGLLGVVFAILNIANVLRWFNGFASWVMLLMFGAFFVFGVYSFTKLKSLKVLADAEKAEVAKVKEWLKTNITKESVSKYQVIMNTAAMEEVGMNLDTADDLAYLRKLELIRADLLQAFPNFNEIYAEQLVDEHYNNYIAD